MHRRLTACLVIALAATLARAGDEPGRPAPAGFNCRVTLTNGRTVTGVVVAPGTWERRNDQGAWEPCSKDDKGACIRLADVGGAPGVVVLDAERIASAENTGAVVQADLDRRAAERAAAEKRAQEQRDKLRIVRKARAEAAAEASKRAAAEAAAAAKAAEEAARAKADADLLAKFPPGEWGAERIEAIKQRSLLRDLLPTELELEFMRVYESWARALEAKKAADALEAAAKAAKDKK